MTKEKKPEWGSGPTIEKIAFNPEQAVLACCSSTVSAVRFAWGAPPSPCLRTAGTTIGGTCWTYPAKGGNCQQFNLGRFGPTSHISAQGS